MRQAREAERPGPVRLYQQSLPEESAVTEAEADLERMETGLAELQARAQAWIAQRATEHADFHAATMAAGMTATTGAPA